MIKEGFKTLWGLEQAQKLKYGPKSIILLDGAVIR